MVLYAMELKTAVVKTCSWGTVENCRVKHSELQKVLEIEEKFERVFLGPKWGYDNNSKQYYTSLHMLYVINLYNFNFR